MKITQINLHHCIDATAELNKAITTEDIKIALIQEPYVYKNVVRGLGNLNGELYYDSTGTNEEISAPGVYITTEPSDAAAASGGRVLLACAARVTSSPAHAQLEVRYSWRHARDGEPSAELLLADNDPNRRQLENGSLLLERLSPAEAGQYRCVAAADGVGRVVSRVASVFIIELPAISEDSPEWARRSVSVWRGAAALLPCAAAAAAGGARAQHRVVAATAGADRRVYGVAQHLQPAVPTVDLTVTWLKNGVALQLTAARMSLTPSGALELEPAREHDAAVYRCDVAPLHAPGVHRLGPEIELQVTGEPGLTDAAPRFITVPQPVTVMEGSAVTFDCAAVGDPRPDMVWLNNGVAIDLNDLDSRFYVVGAGSLRVLSVRALDAGTYTCRATNRHDSADRTTHLTVLTPPRMTRVRAAVAARARGDAELTCEARGRPAPSVAWLKDGEPLTPNHDISLVNGNNLRIQGVLSVDAGMFQCVATSAAGSAQAATRLVVLPPADEVPKKPPKAKGAQPKVKPNRKTKPDIDTKSILNSLRSSGNTEVPFTLRDINLKPGNTRSHPDSRHILSSLRSNTDKPFDFDNRDDSNGSDSPNDPDAEPADSFLGETSSAFTSGPDLDSDVFGRDGISPVDDNEIWSEGGEDTAEVNSTVPAPAGLRPVIVKHRFVTLSWEEPENKEGVIAYAVVYRVKGSVRLSLAASSAGAGDAHARAPSPSRSRKTPSSPSNLLFRLAVGNRERVLRSSRAVQEMNVASLSPDTDYQFRVVAYTSNGASPPSHMVEVHTPAEEWSRGAPRDVRAEGLSPSSLRVSWSAPDGDEPVDKYRLQWSEVESGRDQYAWSAPGATDHIISGLRAATLYAVRVSAGGGGAPSPDVRARTLQDAPDAPPANVTAQPHTATSILVRWEAPPARSHRGPLTGYKIRYRLAAPSPRRKADSLTTPADARRAELRQLERATAYQVRVCALNANGSGPFSEWVTVETAPQELDESRVPTEPGPLRTRAGRDWISVWWSAAGEGGGEGGVRVRNYSLAWGLGIPDEHSHVLPDDARNHVVRDLVSNAEYVISLRATNTLGSGPPVYATVRTKPDLTEGDEEEDEGEEGAEGAGAGAEDEEEEEQPALIPPVGLKVIMLSGTTAVVYWTDTTLPKGQMATDGRRYVVQWSAVGGGSAGRVRHFNATDLNCMIDELRPHTTYEFAVKLIRGGRESAWSMVVSNTTLEAAPGSAPRDLLLAPAPPLGRAADLVWTPPAKPNGVITGYVIMYSTEARRNDRDWVAAAVLGDRRAWRVDRLRPRTTYHFKLQARNSKGLGPFLQPVAFTTPDESGETSVVETGASGAWLWACAGGAVAVLAVAAALALSLCCRRQHPPLSPDRSTYQKSSASAAIKPPDLWIHHDQMELKQLDKSHHSSSISAGSVDNANALVSSTLTLGRSAPPGDYEPARHHAPPVGSVDRRHYVPTYVDSPGTESCHSGDTAVLRAPSVASGASSGLSGRRHDLYDHCKPMSSVSGTGVGVGVGCAAACERGTLGYARPPHPRPLHVHPDQSTPLLAGGVLGSPQSSLGSLGPHHPPLPMPCAASVCPLGAACGGTAHVVTPGTGDLYAVASRERERGHYVAYEPLGHYTHRDSVSEVGGGSTGGSLQRRAATAVPPSSGLHSFTLPTAHSAQHSTHSTPSHGAVTIRASNTSPYKKNSISGSSTSGSPGHAVRPLHAHSAPAPPPADTLTPSRSTERLQREMANLEGLMKDLSAITQQQFQC